MKKKISAILMLLLIVGLPVLKAETEDVWAMAQSDQYGKKATGQLGRGVLNVATCFVDVITQTVDGTQHGTPFVGTLTGLGSGIACTALRVTSGALDIATFWVPGFNGFPVSRSYNNCLESDTEVTPREVAAPSYEAPTPAPKVEEKAEPAKSDVMEYVKK